MNNTLDIDENVLVSSLNQEQFNHLALGIEMNFHAKVISESPDVIVYFDSTKNALITGATVSQVWRIAEVLSES